MQRSWTWPDVTSITDTSTSWCVGGRRGKGKGKNERGSENMVFESEKDGTGGVNERGKKG